MEREKVLVSAEETARQKEYMDKVRALHERRTTKPLAYVHTYGCQQNVADGERLMGMLREMGCEFTDIRTDRAPHALGHLARRLFRDRAMRRERRMLHADKLFLDLVRI